MRKTNPVAAVLLMMASFCARPARAEFVMNFTQNGSDVVEVGSGSLNITDLSLLTTGEVTALIDTGNHEIIAGPVNNTSFSQYQFISNISSLSSGNVLIFANGGSGDLVGFFDQYLLVPVGYTSGALANTDTWNNQTFASLGLNTGTFYVTWGSGAAADDIKIIVGGAAVPEPASALLFAAPAAAMLLRRRKRQA